MALAFGLSKWWFHRYLLLLIITLLETSKSINSNTSVIEERASKTEKGL